MFFNLAKTLGVLNPTYWNFEKFHEWGWSIHWGKFKWI